MPETTNFQDWLDDWLASLTPRARLGYKIHSWWDLHIWYHISTPIYNLSYSIWHWIGEKCDWLELVYWELENEDQYELTEEELAAWNKMFDD